MPLVQTDRIGSASRTSIVEVTDAWFGAILINKDNWSKSKSDFIQFNQGFIRFPGGTLAEMGMLDGTSVTLDGVTPSFDLLLEDRDRFAYDLTFPDLVNPLLISSPESDNGGFSDAIDLAVETGSDLSILMPVRRYIEGVDFRSEAELTEVQSQIRTDLASFLGRLESGTFNDGVLPKKLIIEIGNEIYDRPLEYAVVARTILDAFETIGIDGEIELAVQMSRGRSQLNNLIDDDYFDALSDTDGLINFTGFDSIDVSGISELQYDERATHLDGLMIQLLGSSIGYISTLRHHALGLDDDNLRNGSILREREAIFDLWKDAVLLQSKSQTNPEYYISAWSVDSDNDGGRFFGSAAATNLLSTLNYFADIGVDRAAVWGLGAAQGYWPDTAPGTTLTTGITSDNSPASLALRLLAESIPGAALLDTGFGLSLGEGSPEDYLMSVFENETDYFIFVAAGELSGEPLSVQIDLQGIGNIESVDVSIVETFDGSNSGPAATRHFELDVVEGFATIVFDADFEFARISLDKGPGIGLGSTSLGEIIKNEFDTSDFERTYLSDDDDEFIFLRESGFVYAGAGDDTISGGNNRSTEWIAGMASKAGPSGDPEAAQIMFGGQGNDFIDGKSGADYLIGGLGDDILVGGSGRDVFVFEFGHDRIADFSVHVDRILLDPALGADWQLRVERSEDQTVLLFDENNSLTIDGILEGETLEASLVFI